MPRRSSIGWFILPCGRTECPVKNVLLDLRSKEECPVKDDDLPDLGSKEECPVRDVISELWSEEGFRRIEQQLLGKDTDDVLDPRLKQECPISPRSEEECPVENDLLEFTSEELSRFTSQFSPENLIGRTYYGKLYRGKMPIASDHGKVNKDVTVKIMVNDERPCMYLYNKPGGHLQRLEDELKFLQAPKIRGHPNLMKVVGYCRKDIVGVVYDINPLDTLHNLITRDDFNWLQRVKTAMALACLLSHLHDSNPSYLIRNFAPTHVVVDQNFTPVLFEFGMLVGGVLGTTVDKSDMRVGPFGYIDSFLTTRGLAAFTVEYDVYAFGILLINLLSKRVLDYEKGIQFDSYCWALDEYKRKGSLVDQSLKDDTDFDLRDGRKITKLAMQCVRDTPKKRPEMKEVFERLMGLRCSAAAAWRVWRRNQFFL